MKEWVKQDEQCVLHVEFRKKFRLPIKLFLPLLEKTRESENFPNDNAPKPARCAARAVTLEVDGDAPCDGVGLLV